MRLLVSVTECTRSLRSSLVQGQWKIAPLHTNLIYVSYFVNYCYNHSHLCRPTAWIMPYVDCALSYTACTEHDSEYLFFVSVCSYLFLSSRTYILFYQCGFFSEVTKPGDIYLFNILLCLKLQTFVSFLLKNIYSIFAVHVLDVSNLFVFDQL